MIITHYQILKILYTKWPYGITGTEILKYLHDNSNTTIDNGALKKYMLQLEKVGHIKIGDSPSSLNIDDTRYFLTPITFLAISEKSKHPNLPFPDVENKRILT